MFILSKIQVSEITVSLILAERDAKCTKLMNQENVNKGEDTERQDYDDDGISQVSGKEMR